MQLMEDREAVESCDAPFWDPCSGNALMQAQARTRRSIHKYCRDWLMTSACTQVSYLLEWCLLWPRERVNWGYTMQQQLCLQAASFCAVFTPSEANYQGLPFASRQSKLAEAAYQLQVSAPVPTFDTLSNTVLHTVMLSRPSDTWRVVGLSMCVST